MGKGGSIMGTESRWYRRNADMLFTKWLRDAGYPAKLIWDPLLAHVTAWGNGRGKCKSFDLQWFAISNGFPEEDVIHLYEAAKAAGAIEDDGDTITITAWSRYQNPETTRKKASRTAEDDNVPECPGQMANVPDNQGMSRTNGECPVHLEGGGMSRTIKECPGQMANVPYI